MPHSPRLATLTLEPFERVNGTPFTISRDELMAERGDPWRKQSNDVGLSELDYGDVVYRFQDAGTLEEVTVEAQVLRLGTLVVRFEALEGFVRGQDAAAFERAGFWISPRFGIAFVPQEPFWVTALARHCLPHWEALRVS